MTAVTKNRARNTPASGYVRVAKPTLLTACLSRPTIQIVRCIAKTAICQKSRPGSRNSINKARQMPGFVNLAAR